MTTPRPGSLAEPVAPPWRIDSGWNRRCVLHRLTLRLPRLAGPCSRSVLVRSSHYPDAHGAVPDCSCRKQTATLGAVSSAHPRKYERRFVADPGADPPIRHLRGQRDIRSPVADDDRREVPRFLQSGARDTEPGKFWKQGIRRRAARTRYARSAGARTAALRAAPSATAQSPAARAKRVWAAGGPQTCFENMRVSGRSGSGCRRVPWFDENAPLLVGGRDDARADVAGGPRWWRMGGLSRSA